MVAVDTVRDSRTVRYSFMQRRGGYNNIEHVCICLTGRGRAIASPRPMAWSIGFPWEKSVHDLEAVGEIYGDKIVTLGIPRWESVMSKDWAKFRRRHVVESFNICINVSSHYQFTLWE